MKHIVTAVGGLQKDIRGLAVVDAEVGMQVYTAIDSSKARRASSQLGEVVVVHLGNNGTPTDEQFYELMELLAGVDRVGSVNVKVPRAWERPRCNATPTPRSSTGTRRA